MSFKDWIRSIHHQGNIAEMAKELLQLVDKFLTVVQIAKFCSVIFDLKKKSNPRNKA